MTFAELKAALSGRGFQHLTDSQLGDDVNAARALLDDMYLWPYREASVIGVAPLYITDLGVIESVANENTDATLAPVDFRELGGLDTSLSGTPTCFYVGQGNIVGTYPTSSSEEIGVQYYRVTPDLAADNDEPAAPSRFHPLIVDIAAQRAYMRTDNFQAAQALQPFIDQRLALMIGGLLGGQQIAGPQGHMAVTEACDA